MTSTRRPNKSVQPPYNQTHTPQITSVSKVGGGRERPPYIVVGKGWQRGSGSQPQGPTAGRCEHRPLRREPGACGRPEGYWRGKVRHPSVACGDITGLRYPHHAAHAEACLHSATAAPAPSRFLRRRRRSTPQPLAGEAFGGQPIDSLPRKGRWMRRKAQTEGGVAGWRWRYPARSGRRLPRIRRGRCWHRPANLAAAPGSAAGEIARPTLRAGTGDDAEVAANR